MCKSLSSRAMLKSNRRPLSLLESGRLLQLILLRLLVDGLRFWDHLLRLREHDEVDFDDRDDGLEVPLDLVDDHLRLHVLVDFVFGPGDYVEVLGNRELHVVL